MRWLSFMALFIVLVIAWTAVIEVIAKLSG